MTLVVHSTRRFNRTTWAWAFYDFANSAYALLIAGVAYQVYFKKVVFEGRSNADFWWGATVAGSILLSAVVAPFLGAAADSIGGFRKRMFIFLTIASVAFTMGLTLVGRGSVELGIVLFFVANCLYNVVLFIYDSFLKLLVNPEDAGKVSGFGWGLGYLGGLVCLACTFPLFSREPGPGVDSAFRLGFFAVGLFFLIFSMPALLFLPSSASSLAVRTHPRGRVSQTINSVISTLRNWREHREPFKFLIAYYFITEAIVTTIYFTANYLSTTFEMATKEILVFTVVVQVVGFPASWLAGYFGDRWNVKKALLVSIAIWAVIVIALAGLRNRTTMYVICVLMGCVIGSTQALGRAFLSNISPSEKVSEIFGFNSLSSRVASTLGPLVFGLVSTASGSQRMAWLSLLPFIGVGAILTARVQFPDKPQ